MTTADVVYVQTVCAKDQTPFYTPAAMVGLALVTFTTPLASVMFPKVVESAALTQQSDALRHALVATALLGGLAAVACSLLPELPLRIIFFRNSLYWRSAPLVPWIAWCLLPLVLANVLISNLLARDRFKVVPWLLVVGAAYAITLILLRAQVASAEGFAGFKLVIGLLGIFSSLLLAVAVWFTSRMKNGPGIPSPNP
jgi:O-antigen/teichoic acid export membrane protein